MTHPKRRTLLWLGLVAALALFRPAGPAAAADQLAVNSPEDAAAIERIERYVNGITTVQARFLQVSSNGDYAEGDVYLSRPGKLRFEYDPPVPVLIIADSLSLVYYDKSLKQVTYLPLWETPLWFLLRSDVNFAEDVIIQGFERDRGSIRLSLKEKDNEELGRVTLVFQESPIELKKWEVVDAQGITTTVSLLDPKFGVSIRADLFRFTDPTAAETMNDGR